MPVAGGPQHCVLSDLIMVTHKHVPEFGCVERCLQVWKTPAVLLQLLLLKSVLKEHVTCNRASAAVSNTLKLRCTISKCIQPQKRTQLRIP
jgi:hypothetical protein